MTSCSNKRRYDDDDDNSNTEAAKSYKYLTLHCIKDNRYDHIRHFMAELFKLLYL